MSLFHKWQAWWRRWRTSRRAMPPPPSADAAEPGEVEPATATDPAPAGAKASGMSPPATAPTRRGHGSPARSIRLALQGGGSHGAFTWGVLDRLLQRDDLAIDAISGTSAGALNAAVLASGLARGGREAAREALQRFWIDVGHAGGALQSPLSGSPFELSQVPGYDWASRFLRTSSPYDYNPLNLNPLRELLARHVDVDALRAGPIRLFVTATAVRSGEARVFDGDALGLDALLASACLPFLFQAVEIDGEAYWDGGYSGNPSIHPLLGDGDDCDIVVVRINPAQRDGVPRSSTQIMDRISEITFNASLIGELRMIGQLNRLQRRLAEAGAQAAECRLHMIADDVDLAMLPASSRMRVDTAFVERLHGFGQAAAARFLDAHAEAIGRYASHVAVEAEMSG